MKGNVGRQRRLYRAAERQDRKYGARWSCREGRDVSTWVRGSKWRFTASTLTATDTRYGKW